MPKKSLKCKLWVKFFSSVCASSDDKWNKVSHAYSAFFFQKMRHFPVLLAGIQALRNFCEVNQSHWRTHMVSDQTYMRVTGFSMCELVQCRRGWSSLPFFRYSWNSSSHHSAFKRGKNCLLRPGGEGKPFWPEINWISSEKDANIV